MSQIGPASLSSVLVGLCGCEGLMKHRTLELTGVFQYAYLCSTMNMLQSPAGGHRFPYRV